MALTDRLRLRSHTPAPAAALLAVAAHLSLVACGGTLPAPAPTGPPDRVTALGRLEPAESVVDVAAPAGARIDRFAPGIQEGAAVKPGDILAYLDTHAEALAARDHAASELAEAQLRRKVEEESGGAAVEDATLNIRRAEEVTKLRLASQEAELRRAAADFELRRAEFERAETLRAGNAILPAAHDAAASALKQAEAVVARAKAAVAEVTEERAIQLEVSRAGLRAARAGRDRGQLSARVATLTQALKLAEARLDRTLVHAPMAGEVLQIVTRPGESTAGQPVLRLGNTDTMVAVAEVYETDVRFVRIGQRVTIESRALGTPVTGRVERVGRIINKSAVFGVDPTAEVDARVIEVRVVLDPNAVTSGFNRHQVNVTIETGGEAPAAGAGAAR